VNILNKFLINKKGGANAILGVVILLFGMLMVMLVVEIGRLYLLAETFKNDLDSANASVWAVVDRDQLANHIIQFHSITETREEGDDRARNQVLIYLQKNMRLSPALFPNNPNGPIAGPVTVERFESYLSSDIPLTNADGIPLNKVSVYTKINVPVRLLFHIFGDIYNMPVYRVTDLEDITK
jgi:hypothetical protein